MNNSGDAAEQIVRMSLEGTEVALRLTGSAAKNIAAGIYAIMKNGDKNKLKGRQRLTSMLKSGKELRVFTVSEKHLKQFAKEAKRYGVVYCALRGKGKSADGLVDVMVRAEDASKINRIVERFKLSTVDVASIKSDIEKSRSDKDTTHGEPERGVMEKSEEDKLVDEMLGEPMRKEEKTITNPTVRTEKSPPSEPTSKKRNKSDEGVTKKYDKPSVREELREIKESRKKGDEPKRKDPERSSKKKDKKSPEHKRPKKKKSKSKGR